MNNTEKTNDRQGSVDELLELGYDRDAALRIMAKLQQIGLTDIVDLLDANP